MPFDSMLHEFLRSKNPSAHIVLLKKWYWFESRVFQYFYFICCLVPLLVAVINLL